MTVKHTERSFMLLFPGYAAAWNDDSAWIESFWRAVGLGGWGRGTRRVVGIVPHRLKSRINDSGYEIVNLYRDGVMITKRVHSLVCEAANGPRPHQMECRHVDGNPLNNHPSNLKWGTRLENARDSVLHGTQARGERNGGAVLSLSSVIEIRRLLGSGRTHRELASLFGVSRSAISHICAGRSWNNEELTP